MSALDASRYPWLDLLHIVNRAVHERNGQSVASTPPESAQLVAEHPPPGWLGATGASETELARHEERLGVRLPPSYREFLQVTNGWDKKTYSSLHLLPVAELGWTRDVDPYLAEVWGPKPSSPDISDEDYFVYGAGQDPMHIRDEYMPGTLYISEYLEGQVYLLNPHIVMSDGEWEAWSFATWKPGVTRFRSFWDLMADEFRDCTS
ncbi:SMI1/KNR4 family protein [Streptosporangium sp. NPDC002524]|uniref:SMI1/KNR4 family protein n=1 Tax=Streptosporangium sp. NPDC002524 TaxID=3154537 RepID=UPI00331CD15B